MTPVVPKVFLVASTQAEPGGMAEYLKHVGAEAWKTDVGDGVQMVPEFMGRLCYRSWAPGLNPNVTKVREGNGTYLKNILKAGHGSVLEHSTASFVIADVSRVFTHELVRHRVGTAISQESLRYVRLETLGLWVPSCIASNPEALELFKKHFELNEKLQVDLAKLFGLDDAAIPFDRKKEVTSAMRRLAPDGLATTIGWTANMRTLRHVIEMRTSVHAEEEIRIVFDQIATLCQAKWPNLFSDYEVVKQNGIGEWKTEFSKV